MAVWRTLTAALVLLAAAAQARAQTYDLKEVPRAGDCFRVSLELSLSGEIRVLRDGKPTALPLAATASHQFTERTLMASEAGRVQKTARLYAAAASTVRVGGDRTTRELPADRRLLVAQRHDGRVLAYSPVGPLTSEQAALAGEHFDTLDLVGLLPGKTVSLKDSWKPDNDAVQHLCQFDGLVSHDIVCTLDEVNDGSACVRVFGSASGIEGGAMTKMTVQANARFDLLEKRITVVEWKQKDERDQGPASPASGTESTTTIKRSPVEVPRELSDVALEGVPGGLEHPGRLADLVLVDPKGRWKLPYPREWHLTALGDGQAVMRLVDRGDFVAQVAVTAWKKADAGKHVSADDLKQTLADLPGWEQEELLQDGEIPSEGGRWTYRIAARGKLEGMSVVQVCYAVADASGEQVILAFNMRPAQVAKLGSRDQALATGLSFGK